MIAHHAHANLVAYFKKVAQARAAWGHWKHCLANLPIQLSFENYSLASYVFDKA